ncbi:hypothetical protein BIV60_20205 [Bacillus sp. MUM 116]|nr:hypothetical protein BIV60_20205 [Bacillus sp. MUM 116]
MFDSLGEINREKQNEIIDKIFPRKQDNVRFSKGFVVVFIKRLIEKISIRTCRFVNDLVLLSK